MTTNRFNEAEQCLLENWQQACLVEKSMKEIRRAYSEILDQVWEAIKEQHNELDWCETVVTQAWCKGYMCVGRNDWHIDDNHAYIDMQNLRMEVLADDKEEAPFIGIWVGKSKKPAMDVEGIKMILSAAEKILPRDEFSWESQSDLTDYEWALWYYLPEQRQELLRMLREGDSQQFADCLMRHFNVFAKFIQVLDQVFLKKAKL